MRDWEEFGWLSVAVIGIAVGLFCIFALANSLFKTDNISIDHVDRNGTIWVTIDSNEYYLYIDDNGMQKRLEMK